uniref:Uncharacterized protein n=1 Tax=Romanomermis culicivorax TaxID=13658 RepID=A0A915HVY7_ROMCU
MTNRISVHVTFNQSYLTSVFPGAVLLAFSNGTDCQQLETFSLGPRVLKLEQIHRLGNGETDFWFPQGKELCHISKFYQSGLLLGLLLDLHL